MTGERALRLGHACGRCRSRDLRGLDSGARHRAAAQDHRHVDGRTSADDNAARRVHRADTDSDRSAGAASVAVTGRYGRAEADADPACAEGRAVIDTMLAFGFGVLVGAFAATAVLALMRVSSDAEDGA